MRRKYKHSSSSFLQTIGDGNLVSNYHDIQMILTKILSAVSSNIKSITYNQPM